MKYKELIDYYKSEAKSGNYHNPEDVMNKIEIAIKTDESLSEEEKYHLIEYESLGHEIGLLFWGM